MMKYLVQIYTAILAFTLIAGYVGDVHPKLYLLSVAYKISVADDESL